MGSRARRAWLVVGGALAAALAFGSWGNSAKADGVTVAQSLGGSLGAVQGLTAHVGPGGAYGAQPGVGDIPFLGADPTQNLPGVFDALNGLGGLSTMPIPAGAKVPVVRSRIQQVSTDWAAGDLTSIDIDCGAVDCTNDDLVTSITAIRFRVAATGGKPATAIPFRPLGLDALNFLPHTPSELSAKLDWTVNVDVVADANGVRLADAPGADLVFTPAITWPMANFTVDLGVLRMAATTVTPPGFSGKINVDIAGAGPAFTFDSAGFKAGWALAPTAQSPLKGITGQVHVDWPLSGGFNADNLKIELNNLKIDTSELVGKQLHDAAQSIRNITGPIRTATSPLMEPVPGLSDLSEILGAGKTTLLHIYERYGGSDQIRPILEKLIVLDDALTLVGGGSIDLEPVTIVGPSALSPDALPANVAQLTKIADACTPCRDAMEAFLTKVGGPGQPGMKFDFPVLKDPSTLARLLLGRDVDLFTFDTGLIHAQANVDIPVLSVIIFSINIGGQFDIGLHIKGGFDTRGIRDAIASGAGGLLNGLYLEDAGDDPVVFLDTRLNLSVVAALGVARVDGGPFADVKFQVPPPPDGPRLRPAVVADGIGCALLKADDAVASIGVKITGEIDIPLIPTIRKTLASHTFVTKEDFCVPNAQANDVADLNGGTLRIKPGSERNLPAGVPDTIKVWTEHNDDGTPRSIVVQGNNNKHEEFPAGPVLALTYTSPDDRPVQFQAVRHDNKLFERSVVIKTGNGNDDVLIDGDALHEHQVELNGGEDTFTGSAADDVIRGGEGDDTLNGRDGNDDIDGQGGNDTLIGEAGDDGLAGSGGNDTLSDTIGKGGMAGGSGDDTLVGGPGNQILIGDLGIPTDPPDAVGTGGAGRDLIVTGGGEDVVVAGDGSDVVRPTNGGPLDPAAHSAKVTVYGNGGQDDIVTAFGPDVIYGGPGLDTINAGDGVNEVHGGTDKDTIVGGKDADAIDGDDGDDVIDAKDGTNTVRGGDGEDEITTGKDADRIWGDRGTDDCVAIPESSDPDEDDTIGDADLVLPGDGNNTVAGEAGNDIIFAGDDEDDVCGHAGEDALSGGQGDDRIWGGSGNEEAIFGFGGDDDIYAGPGDDQNVNGHDGDDLIMGGTGEDRIFAGPDYDIVNAGDNGDYVEGGTETDFILGEGGEDELFGNAGEDFVDGGPESDLIDGGSEKDFLFGRDGNDHLFGQSGPDRIEGGEGNDDADGGDDPDEIFGQNGDDKVLLGGRGIDSIEGGDGEDEIDGGDDGDFIFGQNQNDTLRGSGGEDRIEAGEGDDQADGGDENDLIFGQNGADKPLLGSRGVDRIEGGDGNDEADGGPDGDFIFGQNHNDKLLGSGGADHIEGGDGEDTASGGPDADVVLGQNGNDPDLSGDGEDDHIEGGAGTDSVHGGGGQDDIIGGNSPDYLAAGTTTAGLGDAGDVLLAGDEGADVIVGDNGRVTRGATPTFTSVDPSDPSKVVRTIVLLDLAIGGADGISGGDQGDSIFGAVGADDINAGAGNDYVEGNNGADAIDGDAGHDDVIGGSSPLALPAGVTTAQLVDVGDRLIGGGDGHDALVGDNGTITHTVVNGTWTTNQGDGTLARRIVLLDRTTIGGPDAMFGGTGNDRMWGALGNDVMHAGGGADFAEGNQGADTIAGSAGADDIIGGTSPDAIGGDANAAASSPDGDDVIYGRAPNEPDQIAGSKLVVRVDLRNQDGRLVGVYVKYGPDPEPAPGTEPDDDVVLGDNARIDRCKPSLNGLSLQWNGRDNCAWTQIRVGFYGPATARFIQPLGEAPPLVGLLGQILSGVQTDHAGKDSINGNDDDDLLLGQDGFDTIHGGAGDDIVYGGLDLNKLYGDGGGIDVVIIGDLSLLRLVGVNV